jgi:hypothetical protein
MCSVLGESFLWLMPLRVKYSTEARYLLMVTHGATVVASMKPISFQKFVRTARLKQARSC